jgi:hypothetical protein
MLALIIALLVLGTQESPQKTPPPNETDAPRRLVVTYSDGRTRTRLLTPRGGSWTPTANLPHQPNPPPHDELPLAALGVDHVFDRDVVVTVSLLYGRPHQRKVHVATVRLSGSEVVRVDDLARFGVDPISLSIDSFPPPVLVQPTVSSASPLLDVSVELSQHLLPIYNITFRNRAPRAVMAVSFLTYRGTAQIISGHKKTNRTTPIVEPAGEYSFTLQAGTGETPGFDRFEVSGVLWDDGRIEGNPRLKDSEDGLTAGYAQQLRRVLQILRASAGAEDSSPQRNLAQIRAAVDALPLELDPGADSPFTAHDKTALSIQTVKQGQQQVKEAVLQDLNDYVRAHGGGLQSSARPWTLEAQPRYAAWLVRTGGR